MRILVNNKEIRGDLIRFAAIRNDAVPIPVTLEAEIWIDESIENGLSEGKTIKAGNAEDEFCIIKSIKMTDRNSTGEHVMQSVKIIALIQSCAKVSFVRQSSIIKESATFSDIYKASGATIKVENDFKIDRFNCYIGETPSFHIARALQENGGIIRYKKGKMTFFRLPDLLNQKPVIALPNNASHDIKSGFSERHEVQFFYSIDDKGQFIYGNKNKARTARFMPFMNEQQLKNLTRCLIKRKIARVYYDETICAGDLVNVVGSNPLVVVTAAHVAKSGTDGTPAEQYTALWLSSVENG